MFLYRFELLAIVLRELREHPAVDEDAVLLHGAQDGNQGLLDTLVHLPYAPELR